MDAWKRCYSNNDTIPDAMNYFWEKMDKENYSCWFGKYKYGDEIPMPFMASNLIRGMFQRLDKMRKHSFSSVAVLGEAPNLEISGVWFWKGQDLAFELSDDWRSTTTLTSGPNWTLITPPTGRRSRSTLPGRATLTAKSSRTPRSSNKLLTAATDLKNLDFSYFLCVKNTLRLG